MKTSKALKRLAKIEAAIADVTERFSASGPQIRALFKDLKAAAARAKEAVSLQPSSKPAKKAAKKAASARKKSAPKKTPVNARVKAAGKSKPARQNVKKKAVKKTAPVPADAVAAADVPEPAPALTGTVQSE
ncbi:MAG: hypothetical protein JJE04_18680 [Acidobacteriia bacterium]|nr:hypothetical protein [Terriglobia bacterium]